MKRTAADAKSERSIATKGAECTFRAQLFPKGPDALILRHWRSKGKKAGDLSAPELVDPIASAQSRCFTAFRTSKGLLSFCP
jgi:hypothetical protein